MTKNRSLKGRSDRHGGMPLFAALAVATFGVLGILIVDHGPWSKPKVKPAVVANYTTTGEAPVHPVNPPTPP